MGLQEHAQRPPQSAWPLGRTQEEEGKKLVVKPRQLNALCSLQVPREELESAQDRHPGSCSSLAWGLPPVPKLGVHRGLSFTKGADSLH